MNVEKACAHASTEGRNGTPFVFVKALVGATDGWLGGLQHYSRGRLEVRLGDKFMMMIKEKWYKRRG